MRWSSCKKIVICYKGIGEIHRSHREKHLDFLVTTKHLSSLSFKIA